MKTNLYLLLFFSISYFCFPSTTRAQKKEERKIYEVLDTIKARQHDFTVNVLWMDDTIRVTQAFKPHELDTFLVKNEKVILSYGPNCFAHALNSYFKSNGISHLDLFDKRTVILTEALTKILDNSFSKIQEFHVKRKRLKNQKEIEENTILVFKNQYNMIGHAVYFNNGIFYTKNGMYPLQEFSDINKIIKTYWDTKTIDVYQLQPKIESMLKQ